MELRHDQIRVGHDERVAGRRFDPVLERPDVLIGRPQDHLMEPTAVVDDPVPDVRVGGIVDERQAKRVGRACVQCVHRRNEMLEPIVAEHDDVDWLRAHGRSSALT